MAYGKPPNPTYIYRLIHVDSLPTLLARNALHAPNATPNDGPPYRTIHNVDVQRNRHQLVIPCGPGGTLHDYVPFYFGPRSVMLFNLHTGRVAGYDEGQEPLIYLVATVQDVDASGARWVFADGHGLANLTDWYEDTKDLDQVDWSLLKEKYWHDTPADNDRQRRKQAEFLVWDHLDWQLIRGIAVLNAAAQERVREALARFPDRHQPKLAIRQQWYYLN